MKIFGLIKTTLLDYPDHLAATIFTGGCNFCCPYCHNKDLVISPDTSSCIGEDEVLSHLKKRANILEGVCITGGEATLQPDLIDFIKKIKDLGLLVKLDTNGTNPELLHNLISQQLVDYVAMDIKHCPSKYSAACGKTDIDISVINKSVDILKAANIDYEFRTTLCSELHNKDDITEIGQWLEGALAYFLQPYRESDQVINPIFTAPSKEDLCIYREELLKYIKKVEIRGMD